MNFKKITNKENTNFKKFVDLQKKSQIWKTFTDFGKKVRRFEKSPFILEKKIMDLEKVHRFF